MAIEFVTNHHRINLLAGYEIPENVWNEHFDYLGTYDEENAETMNPRFFRYKGWWYDVNDFTFTGKNGGRDSEHIPAFADKGWDFYASDSYGTGVAFSFVPDPDMGGMTDLDAVKVAYYIVKGEF